MHGGHDVSPIIDNEMGTVIERQMDVAIVRLSVLATPRIDGKSICHQCSSDVILRRQRIAGADHRCRPTCPQGIGEIRRLGRDVHASNDTDPFERAFPREPLLKKLQDRHFTSCPRDPLPTLLG